MCPSTGGLEFPQLTGAMTVEVTTKRVREKTVGTARMATPEEIRAEMMAEKEQADINRLRAKIFLATK